MSHRPFSASTGLHISPKAQPWAFNSFCPTPDCQKSEESRRAQQNSRCSHNALMAGHYEGSRCEGSAPSTTGDDGMSSASDLCGIGCHAPLATPEVIPSTALLSSLSSGTSCTVAALRPYSGICSANSHMPEV